MDKRIYRCMHTIKLFQDVKTWWHTRGSRGSVHVFLFVGCIMRGSAVLVKENGRYQRGIVGTYISGNSLEVFLLGYTLSKIVARSQLIQDEKPNIHELAIGKLVLVEDVGSPGLITEGKIEQIEDSVCTIKTNNKTWKSDLNKIRIIKISDFCPWEVFCTNITVRRLTAGLLDCKM